MVYIPETSESHPHTGMEDGLRIQNHNAYPTANANTNPHTISE